MEIIVFLGILLSLAGVGGTLLASWGERLGGDVPLVRRRAVVHLPAD